MVLRWSIGGLLLLHGLAKLQNGIEPIKQMFVDRNMPHVLGNLVYIGEIVAPVLLILGLFTRPAAIIVIVQMLIAIAMAHIQDLGQLSESGGWKIELPALYLFGALAITLIGPGRWRIGRGQSVWS